MQLPIEPLLKLIALGLALAIAVANGAGMMASWTTFALFWHAPRDASLPDPIFGRPLGFYLFTLPAWQLIAGWLLTLAVIVCLIAGVLVLATSRAARRGRARLRCRAGAVVARAVDRVALLLLTLALRAYLGRFERLFQDDTIFAGVTYTDAHVTLAGMLAGLRRAARRRCHRGELRDCRAEVRAGCWRRRRRRSPATSASRWSAGTSAASSSSRTSWCASGPSSRTTSR